MIFNGRGIMIKLSMITAKMSISLLMFLFVPAASFSADTKTDEVWRRYLSPPEMEALIALQAVPQEPMPKNADQATLLAAMREGFAKMAAEFAPPLPGQRSRLFSEEGAEGFVEGLWIEPESTRADRILLYLHGGGYMVGSAATGGSVAGYLAVKGGMHAFSLEYPLAPESPYPAQLNCAEAAYRFLLRKGFKPENIVIAGDSAGGNLALTLLLRLRSAALPMPAGAYLISPWTDLTHSSPTHELKRDVDAVLNHDFMEWMATSFVGAGDREDPLVSPVFGDLNGFPPLLVQVGSFETLLDDSLTLVRNAALADVPVRLSVWPGYNHDFQMGFAHLKGAERALDEAAAFLCKALEGNLIN